jgi:MscS family membrane protein
MSLYVKRVLAVRTLTTWIPFVQAGHAGRVIEGIVMEIGWYRTLIRSFEREVYVVPNSVFSRTVVLNVTRKGKEWRVFERIGIRVDDVDAVPDIIQDMREIIREVRLSELTHKQCQCCTSWYDCSGRSQFL